MIAGILHATHQTLAPEHGYETSEVGDVDWDEVPANSRALMVATVQSMLDMGVIVPGPLGALRAGGGVPADDGRETARG